MTPLYRAIMGDAWERLLPAVRRMHDVTGHSEASGTATVRRGTTIIAHVICAYAGFPKNGDDVPVRVVFTVEDGVETWTRTFGGSSFSSVLRKSGPLLEERFGPLRFRFLLKERDGMLRMIPKGWSILGLRMPAFLGPKGVASEGEEDGVFTFNVPIRLFLIGLVVHYKGTLRPIDPKAKAHEGA